MAGVVKNAGYDAATDTIIPEQMGAEFDVTTAQTALEPPSPVRRSPFPPRWKCPPSPRKSWKTSSSAMCWAECRTHVSGTSARINNVKLSSAAFNGVVLNSGEVFSYNGTVGERTAAKGYRRACLRAGRNRG